MIDSEALKVESTYLQHLFGPYVRILNDLKFNVTWHVLMTERDFYTVCDRLKKKNCLQIN